MFVRITKNFKKILFRNSTKLANFSNFKLKMFPILNAFSVVIFKSRCFKNLQFSWQLFLNQNSWSNSHKLQRILKYLVTLKNCNEHVKRKMRRNKVKLQTHERNFMNNVGFWIFKSKTLRCLSFDFYLHN